MTFLTDDWASAVRRRVGSPYLVEARSLLEAQTRAYREWLPATPDQQAGYYHNFFCPQHAVQLIFDARSPQRHTCPVDGAAFAGEPFDSAWLWSVNDMLSDAALKLAFHSFVTDVSAASQTTPAAQRATAILSSYADRYRDLPRAPGPQHRYPGHATCSSLDESVWIIRLAWAYALLCEHMPAPTRQAICQGLLRPAADHIWQARRHDVHNITNWNNAALATLGLALDDGDLLAESVSGPVGLVSQLSRGVRDDGFWYEGSPSYHFYALAALIWHVRALRAGGRAFDDGGVLRRMFAAPIAIAYPDLTLPALHDCWYAIGLSGAVGHGIPDATGFYEIGFGWYGEPLFASILQHNYATRARSCFEALLDGAETIPAAQMPVAGDVHARGSGLAVMRRQVAGDGQSYLMLKAGPAVPGHGHPDQLSIQVFAHGERWSPDLGTPGYGIGLNETWYRQTASHNTALLDGLSQPLADGSIECFDSGEGYLQGAVSWYDGEHAGVQMRRVIVWGGGYWLDAFFVDCSSPRQIDWVYHCRGALVTKPASDPGADLGSGAFSHISGVQRVRTRSGARLGWQLRGARCDLFLSPRGVGETYTGDGPSNPASESLTVVVRRVVAERAVFVALLAPSAVGAGPVVRRVLWRKQRSGALTLFVDTEQGRQTWHVHAPRVGETDCRLVSHTDVAAGGSTA